MSETTYPGSGQEQAGAIERQKMAIDIACVGFGPANAGFLSTLSRELLNEDGTPRYESLVTPGLPLQVICYERADDFAFGVSGVVTRARGLRESIPDIDWSQIPFAAPVSGEKLLYLLDPVGASRRSAVLRFADRAIRGLKAILPYHHEALELPYIPPFMRKHGGAVLSIGQFNQWLATQLIGSGTVQIWPGTPVAAPLIDLAKVSGIRLVDQGVDKSGQAEGSFMPGMDIEAALTVLGDGPVGPVSRQLDEHFGLPPGHQQNEWAVGMKMVVNLRDHTGLKPGMVFHSFGYPEPEIFGFMYVYPDNVASLGIFVPSWFENPVRTAYRYLQHWMLHPYFWRYLQGGTLRSWGAKSLFESGKRGEPYLVGDGYARIGEGSGTTNVLTGSGVDEAWTSGAQLAKAVLQLLQEKKPFSRENLEATYVKNRRKSWLEKEARIAEKARNGFHHGIVPGLLGMALSGFSQGFLNIPGKELPPFKRLKSAAEFFSRRLSANEVEKIKADCLRQNLPAHDALMEAAGWPAIPYDGSLLVSQQDALLLGGKVQAQAGYADHVVFLNPDLCRSCGEQTCIEMCSGQAITPGENHIPVFDREKCIHCGACLWNCSQPLSPSSTKTNIDFRAGSGGLHSAEN